MRQKPTNASKKIWLTEKRKVGLAILFIAIAYFIGWLHLKSPTLSIGQIDDTPLVISFLLVMAFVLISFKK